MQKHILIVPAAEQGLGGGHITRCISLVKDLRALDKEACLYMPHRAFTAKTENLFKTMNFNKALLITDSFLSVQNDKSEKYGMIILDRFQTPADEFLRWKQIAPVIGIDEGGSSRDDFDFLIDILIPEKMGKTRANIASPSLILKKFTANQHESVQPARTQTEKTFQSDIKLKVLITFGHEDASGLGLKTARYLSALVKDFAMDITLIKGALAANSGQLTINNVLILHSIPNLAERLNEYDIVITHYGITAYEALYAGTSVLLAHPTSYHKKLAKAAGFTDIKKLKKVLLTLSNRGNHAQEKNKPPGRQLSDVLLKNDTTLADLINSYSPQVNRQCPVCGVLLPVPCPSFTVRFRDRTYRRCNKCGIIYMDRTSPPPVEYAKEYFFESYKKQYGKTYLEDFENIKAAAKLRLKRILEIYSRKDADNAKKEKKKYLLDIGCAYGPFMAAAKEEGFSPTGIDPAEDAVRYVKDTLDITAIQGFFPDILVKPQSPLPTPYSLPSSFDAVTLWFVIEHFKDCTAVLAEIKRILKPHGILAFSTPSFSGISGRKNLANFLSVSPADHYTLWSPKTCRKVLSLAGFKVKKIVSAGHHPERFPLLGKLSKTKKSPFYWLLLAISKLFRLGDTFEVYAYVKE